MKLNPAGDAWELEKETGMRVELWKDSLGELHFIEEHRMIEQPEANRESWSFVGHVDLAAIEYTGPLTPIRPNPVDPQA